MTATDQKRRNCEFNREAGRDGIGKMIRLIVFYLYCELQTRLVRVFASLVAKIIFPTQLCICCDVDVYFY